MSQPVPLEPKITIPLGVDPLKTYKRRQWARRVSIPEVKEDFRKSKWESPRLQKLYSSYQNQYQYHPLKDDEIRLVMLEPKSEDKKIHCTILARPLREVRGVYDALSYYWGTKEGEQPRNPVYVKDAVPHTASFHELVLYATGKKKIEEKEFLVHDNLFSALEHLQQDEEQVLIWIDAICINQREEPEGVEEKQKQVPRMADIYNSASNVLVWLGAPEESTNVAMEFIENIVDLHQFDNLILDKNSIAKWEALTNLMKYHWFSRRWVVQEIALARSATLHCGNKSVDWVDFSDAVELFVTKLDDIIKLFGNYDALRDVEALGAIVLVQSIRNLARKSEDGSIQEHLVGLEVLVSRLLFFEASKPHDVIYCVLSLARDTPRKYYADRNAPLEKPTFKIDVNYQRPVVEVFIEFVKCCIENSRSLDIICRHWAPHFENAILPSWILKVTDSSFGSPEQTLQGRRSGDSLVGAPYLDSRKTYNASRGTTAEKDDFCFGDLPVTQTNATAQNGEVSHSSEATPTSSPSNGVLSGILNVKGFQFATVASFSQRIIGGMIPKEWLIYGGWNPSKKSMVPEKLWKTLVADRDPNGANPPGWYSRACAQCLSTVAITNVNGDMNVDYVPSKMPPHSDAVMQFLKRVRSIVYNRCFFLAEHWCWNCESKGHHFLQCPQPLSRASTLSRSSTLNEADGNPGNAIRNAAIAIASRKDPQIPADSTGTDLLYGLGPGTTLANDIICILAGCTVPVILRKIPNSSDETCYRLVGEAYVYGKMDGEAMAGLDYDTVKSRFSWFTLK